jgi:hypothetical protein
MDFVLHECLGDYVPLSPRFPSPPCRRSFSPDGCENPSAEEGDSRETVEAFIVQKLVQKLWK